jgi:hypothetical protein
MILLGAGVKVNGRTRWRIRDQMVRELDVHDGGAFAIACEHDIACFVSEPGLRGSAISAAHSFAERTSSTQLL